MFKKIKSQEELLTALKEKVRENLVIHYNCENCSDEQVTDNIEITEGMIEQFETEGCIWAIYPCTECGRNSTSLSDNVFGVEDIDKE